MSAVENIVSSSYEAIRARREDRAVVVLSLLEAIERADWYTDGVSAADVLRISGIFEVLSSLNNTIGSFTAKYDWISLVEQAVEAGTVESLQPSSGGRIQIVVAAEHQSEGVAEALEVAAGSLAWIERHTRPIGKSVLIVLDDELSNCGEAIPQAVLVRPECGIEAVLPHELVHFAMPSVAATWFTEGYAYLLAGILSTDYSATEIAAFEVAGSFEVGGYYLSSEEYGGESREGMVFLANVVELVGFDVITTAIGNIWEGVSGQQALRALYEATPEEHREEMLELIHRSCVEQVWLGALVTCDPT